MRALSQREKWFRPAWWTSDSSGTVASASSRPRRSAARPTSVPSGRRNTKSPKPKCSSITSRSSWRRSGDPFSRKSAPTLWASASFSGREEWSTIGTSGYAARTWRAKSAPARGTFSPARGNSTSEMMPRTSSAYRSNARSASSHVVQSRIFGRARMRRIFWERFRPSTITRCEWCRSSVYITGRKDE